MARDTLPPEQRQFLDAFFELNGNVRAASEACGFTPNHGYYLARKLKDEILDEASYILALGAPSAARALVEGVDPDKPAPASANRIKCATEILDRIGIARKDRIEISSENAMPIFILPPKDHDSNPEKS